MDELNLYLVPISLALLAVSLVLPKGFIARGAYYAAAGVALVHIFGFATSAPLSGGTLWPVLAAIFLLLAACNKHSAPLKGFPALALVGALQAVCCLQMIPWIGEAPFVWRVGATLIGCVLPWIAVLRLFSTTTLLPAATFSVLFIYLGLAEVEPLCPLETSWFCLVGLDAAMPVAEIVAFSLAMLFNFTVVVGRILVLSLSK